MNAQVVSQAHVERSTEPALDGPGGPAPFEVLDNCHKELVKMLGQMAELMRHVDANGVDSLARQAAHDIHLFFSTTAVNHHLDEERHIFPSLLTSPDAELVHITQRLQQDHGWLEEDWLALAPQLDSMARGYSWYDLDELRHGIEVFAGLYHDHVRLEESLIYPEARTRLSGADLQTMSREMAQRRSHERKAGAAPHPST